MKRAIVAAVLILLSFLPAAATAAPSGEEPDETVPLLPWSLLRHTHYGWGGQVTWAEGLDEYNGKVVRLEGYILPKFGSQDPADLLVAGAHPLNLFCGPTDMTALVEVYLPEFEVERWPDLPVEVWGTFSLSKRPEDLQAIYRLRAEGWRPLKRWIQDFPGVVEDPVGSEDN